MVSTHQPVSIIQCLPAEIIDYIITFLPPSSIANLCRTCRLMNTHCSNDSLWARFVKQSVPARLESPSPCKTWRDLYLSHHPYWFLTQNKLWFADRTVGGNTMTGSVMIARYDPRRGCIEGYRLVAEYGQHTFESWEWQPDVIIHTFDPRVQLWLDDPVLKLDLGRQRGNRLRDETKMQMNSTQGVRSALSLCQAIPERLQQRSMALWPPAILPARHRVRSESSSMFRDAGHRPRRLEEASDQTFRLRKWIDFGMARMPLGVRLGEDVLTFSTLPEESYKPTKDKPWQGIWVGDYSGHGCEFLVVLQRDIDPKVKPITPTTWAMDSPEWLDVASDEESEYEPLDDQELGLSSQSQAESSASKTTAGMSLPEAEDDPACKGRLEAIKLTGDPNVPRGEYTWIAEDIGPRGLVRVAHEQMFKGARVVKSLGHCAARGFRKGMAGAMNFSQIQ